MNQLGFLGIDQYGTNYNIKKYPRKELIEKIGRSNVSIMYTEDKTGNSKKIGYVVGQFWITLYRIYSYE